MEKRILTFLLVVACSVMGLHARAVKGTVVDQVNEPVIGANVLVNGTVMAVTDFDGNFEIANVPDGATLKFTFMGMKAVEMKATDVMNVQMEDDVRNLDEVVVIGYGSAQENVNSIIYEWHVFMDLTNIFPDGSIPAGKDAQ